jgi:hypothetical protein
MKEKGNNTHAPLQPLLVCTPHDLDAANERATADRMCRELEKARKQRNTLTRQEPRGTARRLSVSHCVKARRHGEHGAHPRSFFLKLGSESQCEVNENNASASIETRKTGSRSVEYERSIP